MKIIFPFRLPPRLAKVSAMLEIQPPKPVKLIDRIEAQRHDLTERERALASYLADHYPNIAFESATSIGAQVGASPATVVRFFAKLGYNGFADFQREVRGQVERRLHSPLERLSNPAAHADDPAGIIQRTFELEQRNLSRTFQELDGAQFAALVARLCIPNQRVFIIGEKKGYSVAHLLYAQLNMGVDDVTLLETGQSLLADRLMRVRPGDLLIAIDVRRYVRSVVQTAKCFVDRGADVAVLTDSLISPLGEWARYRLVAATEGATAFDSYLGLFALVNTLVNGVTLRRKQQVADNLAAGEALWEAFSVFDQPLPRAARTSTS